MQPIPDWVKNVEPYARYRNGNSRLLYDALVIALEALGQCNGPETDWENGETGVGNTFRNITRMALEKIAALPKTNPPDYD